MLGGLEDVEYLLGTGKGAKQGANTHERDKKRLDNRNPFLFAGAICLCESIDKVIEQEHSRNLSGIVAKEEATDRGGGTEEDGLRSALGAIDGDGTKGKDKSVTIWMDSVQKVSTYVFPSILTVVE